MNTTNPPKGVTALGVSRKRTWPEPKRGLQKQGIVLFEVGMWVFICNPIFLATFGQNELAMAVGLATLHVLKEERVIEHAAAIGEKLLARLAALRERYDMIADVRGKGLMIGIEFQPPRSLGLRAAWVAAETAQKGLFAQLVVMALMREHRILTQVGGPDINIIKLLPPLVIGDAEVDMIVSAFDAVMAEAVNVSGRVWAQSMQLIKHALAG